MDFHIGPVVRSQGNGAVEHELHVACAAGFLGGKGNLFGYIAGRYQLLSQGHVVVIDHDYLQPWFYIRVIVNDLFQAEDHVDDILCNHISRRCLGPE